MKRVMMACGKGRHFVDINDDQQPGAYDSGGYRDCEVEIVVAEHLRIVQ